VVKAKQSGKPSNCDLISLPINHSHHLAICIKVQSGIELIDDLIVPIVLEAHHLGHLELITFGFDFVEDSVTLSSHPLPINPLGLHHGFLGIAIDKVVPICMKVRQKPQVQTLLIAFIHRITMIAIDDFLLGLLGIHLKHAVGVLNG
jgi:hypothetical protein